MSVELVQLTAMLSSISEAFHATIMCSCAAVSSQHPYEQGSLKRQKVEQGSVFQPSYHNGSAAEQQMLVRLVIGCTVSFFLKLY